MPFYKKTAAIVCLSILATACGGSSSSSEPAYSISGTILADSATAVDSDINNIQTTPVANNSFETAQRLTVPVVLGGYVNQPNQGPSGNSFINGDIDDIFLLSFKGNEIIRIALPDKSAASGADFSLSLYAYNDTATPIRNIDHMGQTASFAVPAEGGDFYIKVQAVSGAGSYRLIAGPSGSTAMHAETAEKTDFEPGQVLIKYKTGAGRSMTNSPISDIAGLHTVEIQANGWMRLQLVDRRAAFEQLGIEPEQGSTRSLAGSPVPDNLKEDTLQVVRALRRMPDVAWAEPNFIRKPFYMPNDPLFNLQWHYNAINLPDAWDLTTGSDQVIVAVLDSGVLKKHPDLKDKLVDGYDFISDINRSNDNDGIDSDANDPGDDESGQSSFHGTHVAGTVAAHTGNNLGVAGVGGNTRIMPVRVLGKDGGTDEDIANGIRWAAGLKVLDDQGVPIPPPAQRADIINMSFGSTDRGTLLQEALSAARAQGVILVAAAGNESTKTPTYPAASPDVVAVGATDINGRRTTYSNFGFIDVIAPGGEGYADLDRNGYSDGILSTAGNDADGSDPAPIYAIYQGTSMAAAHVSGVAALMKAVRPGMTPDEFDAYLQAYQLTVDLDSSDDGYGLIDAWLAVTAALETDPPAVLSVSPRTLYLDAVATTARVSLRKIGSDTLTIETPVTDSSWLSVEYADNQPDSMGQYQVSVNRDILQNEKGGGLHTGTITFASSMNSVDIQVTAQVLPDPSADSGLQYVQLINADNDDDKYQLIASANNGIYSFSFTNIPAGTYNLISSTDLDNDRFLLRQGEAGGGYRSLTDMQAISLQSDLSDIQFTVGFSQRPFFEPQHLGHGFTIIQEAP